ncbi:MAG TPA: multicopper oxidase [Polyangia bacterium]|nr:multicopper oxidase [Polyangia bacterium]
MTLALTGCGGEEVDDQPAGSFGTVQQASELAPQTPLDGASIPKYVEALPTLSDTRVDVSSTAQVDMLEFRQKVLPASIYASLPAPFNAGTLMWGYRVKSTAGTIVTRGPSWPAATVQVRQNRPVFVTYLNDLDHPALQRFLTQDLTLHWADPQGTTRNNRCNSGPPLPPACTHPYGGPIPATAHLHGAEVLSAFDGHPDSWFTPGLALRGPAFSTNTYTYPNGQEATTLWFHDHALGMTRLNVYSGLAGFYLIRDGRDTGASNNPIGLPAGRFEQELLIADRQFDTSGQLLFPDGSPHDNPTGINGPPPNPERHPFWIPEFFGDVMTVNGKSWPFFRVQPRRYRFRVVNSSNARFLQMQLVVEGDGQPTAIPGPAIWQIGSDGGLLNTPTNLDDPENVKAPHLFLAPAERADVIIDFAGRAGQRFILSNLQSAVAPFPSGDPPDPATSGQVMEFRVDLPLDGADTTFNPAGAHGNLRAQPIVDIKPADTGKSADKKRQVILVEVEGDGGPEEVLLNNSHWNGRREGTNQPITGSLSNGHGLASTENPQVGATEIWEIANLTEDAHPIHIHLVQFQVINRQSFDRDAYRAAWDSSFPGGTFNGVTFAPGTFIPGFGPPHDYNVPNAAGAIGGNLDFTPFLQGSPAAPDPSEGGWKDTLKMKPFEVTRIAVRWAPQRIGVSGVRAGQNTFSFDPGSQGPGYVWHCHILDHEDNEMMRPYLVTH